MALSANWWFEHAAFSAVFVPAAAAASGIELYVRHSRSMMRRSHQPKARNKSKTKHGAKWHDVVTTAKPLVHHYTN